MKTSTAPFSTRTSRSTPRSAIVSTGISGSTTAAAAAHAREHRSESLKARVIVGTASPSRVRIGALHELQLGEDVAEVLAVASGTAAGLHPLAYRKPQARLGQDGDGEIAVWLLDQQDIAVFARVAPIGERVLVPPPPFHLPGIGVERSRLADQIARHIAERQILLEHGRMAAPFREPVPEHERIVGKPQRVDEERC